MKTSLAAPASAAFKASGNVPDSNPEHLPPEVTERIASQGFSVNSFVWPSGISVSIDSAIELRLLEMQQATSGLGVVAGFAPMREQMHYPNLRSGISACVPRARPASRTCTTSESHRSRIVPRVRWRPAPFGACQLPGLKYLSSRKTTGRGKEASPPAEIAGKKLNMPSTGSLSIAPR